MRLYELAKELGLSSRKLLSFFKSKNVTLKSNLVKVSDEQADIARKTFARRVKLLKSEELLKQAREEEKKERDRLKKEDEKRRREEEKKRKAEEKERQKKEKEQEKKKKAAAKKKAPAKKARPKGKTVADKVAEKLSKSQKATTAPAKKKKTIKKPDVEEVEEDIADKSPLIKLGDEVEELDQDDLKRKVLELEEEARKREEREEKRASFLKRRQGWGVDGGRARARPRRRQARRKFVRRSAPAKHIRPEEAIVELPVTVRTFSSAIGVKVKDIIGYLMRKGERVSINTTLERQMAEEIGLEFGVEVEFKEAPDVEDYLASLEHIPVEEKDLVLRPPVITMLGHVDHGKTSLLDRIRHTNVHEHEAGGITQHISAYRIDVDGRELVFVDTPGHEAFTEMRARGANVTDLVVLVVAADDGVMPQTEEAINHAKAAGVPIVVALNKIDRPNANALRAKQQLATLGFTSEEWGGETVVVEVSAITGQGIEDLLEMLVLSSEMLDLKANPKRPALGTVLEARLSAGVGVAATVVVKDGTLRVGDDIIAGSAIGRVRAMYSMKGDPVEEALPSWPVQVTGLSDVPGAGDRFYVVEDVQRAREAVDQRREKSRAESVATREAVTLENIFAKFQAGKIKELRLVLKADVRGTADVIKATLEELSTDEVKVRILHLGVGSVNESDILLADASEAIVIGFTVKVDEKAKELADEKKVDVRIYDVIYELTSHVKAAMEGLLEPEEREVITGHCEVRQAFRSSRLGVIAGCHVLDGYVTRNSRVRLKRGDETLFDGGLESLRRFKDDVREVKEGFECGMKLNGFDNVQVGDIIETYEIEKVARKLE